MRRRSRGKISPFDDNQLGCQNSLFNTNTTKVDNSSCAGDDSSPWPHPLHEHHNQDFRKPCSTDEVIRSNAVSSGSIRIKILTWNQEGRSVPPAKDLTKSFFPTLNHHIIAFGAQECERSFVRSIFKRRKTRWEATLIAALGSKYKLIRSHSLQRSHLLVFVHESVLNLISDLTSIAVPTGFGDTFGNKGGIGISFVFGGKSKFCLVSGHLAAHQNNIKRRTYEFGKISREVVRWAERRSNLSDHSGADNPKQTNHSRNPLLNSFDFVFWFGDLNYRIQGTRRIIDRMLQGNKHQALRNSDQLNMLMQFDDDFLGFSEGPLNFRPTYKFDKLSDVYDTSKKRRIPSWTDRILFKKGDDVQLLTYDCASDVRTSDHRPVYASFLVNFEVDKDFVPSDNRKEKLKIVRCHRSVRRYPYVEAGLIS